MFDFKMFQDYRWPNMITHTPNGHCGHTWFSEAEINRRQELVRKELERIDADFMMAQAFFPCGTMGCQQAIRWLTGYDGYRNTVTVLVPRNGEVKVIQGMKYSSHDNSTCKYIHGEDILGHIKGAKKIAYYNMGQIGHYFYEYLMENLPGLELVDFSDKLGQFMCVKSEEELLAERDCAEIQDRLFKAASFIIYPGRCIWEVIADSIRMLQTLGADPSLMYKIIVCVGDNRTPTTEYNLWPTCNDRHYRIKPTDWVRFNLEGPGSGGYTLERARFYFFEDPHPELVELHAKAKQVYDYQMSIMKPGATMAELTQKINEYKRQIGSDFTERDNIYSEIRGIGASTVDRPQINCEWETMPLTPGHVVTNMGWFIKDGKAASVYDTAIITETGAQNISSFPTDLIVL